MRHAIYRPRKFDPLPANHPVIGDKCLLCGDVFKEGDVTALIPSESLEKPNHSLTVEAAVVHWTCIEEELPELLEPEEE